MNEPALLTADEVGTLLGVSAASVRRLAKVSGSPVAKARVDLGIRTMRFRRTDIVAVVEGQRAEIVPFPKRQA